MQRDFTQVFKYPLRVKSRSFNALSASTAVVANFRAVTVEARRFRIFRHGGVPNNLVPDRKVHVLKLFATLPSL